MKKLRASIFLAAIIAVQAIAQDTEPDISSEVIETWSCYDVVDYSKKSPLVVLSRHKFTNNDTQETIELGEVEVAAVNYGSLFRVTGFDRRWDFGPEDRPTSFAFIIKPNGDGLYYDFTDSDEGVSPSQFFKCEKG